MMHPEPPPVRRLTAKADRARRRVLVVGGGSDAFGRSLASYLRQLGYGVDIASDGAVALAQDCGTRPLLVLCKWVLTDMTGPQLCAALRKQASDRHIHFILVGSWSDDESPLQALEGGVDDVLRLPLDQSVLKLRLAAGERILDMAQQLTETNRAMSSALQNLREAQRAMDRDLSAARRLQQGLVRNRYQAYGKTRFSLLLRPSGHVGGDLVGCFPISDVRIGTFALDVSGYGVTAALTAARLSAYLAGGVGQHPALNIVAEMHGKEGAGAPAEIVSRLNRMMLADQIADTYLTMIYVEMDIVTGQGVLVQAGHPNPLLQAADGSVRPIGGGGLPVGLIEDAEYEETVFQLQPGERLFIASDGLNEAESPRGDLLGDEGLSAAMQMNARLGGQAFVESLCWSVNRFTEGRQEDDISAVLIEYCPPDLA